MSFSEKLRTIRKKAGFSQEQLAEKLNVSRQAVTKWETDGGIPEIENLMAISSMFDISIDELLSNDTKTEKKKEYLYESTTEYDIAESKHYDMKFGGAKLFVLSGYEGEKIHITLASNTLQTLQSDFKIKIDDVRKRIDVNLIRRNSITEADAKKSLCIFVEIPSPYIGKIECAVNTEEIEVRNLECEDLELDCKTPSLILDGVIGRVEVNCNLDMNIICKTLSGSVEINQIAATSRIVLPEDSSFAAIRNGLGTKIMLRGN